VPNEHGRTADPLQGVGHDPADARVEGGLEVIVGLGVAVRQVRPPGTPAAVATATSPPCGETGSGPVSGVTGVRNASRTTVGRVKQS
jgi:hypothetical protein